MTKRDDDKPAVINLGELLQQSIGKVQTFEAVLDELVAKAIADGISRHTRS